MPITEAAGDHGHRRCGGHRGAMADKVAPGEEAEGAARVVMGTVGTNWAPGYEACPDRVAIHDVSPLPVTKVIGAADIWRFTVYLALVLNCHMAIAALIGWLRGHLPFLVCLLGCLTCSLGRLFEPRTLPTMMWPS